MRSSSVVRVIAFLVASGIAVVSSARAEDKVYPLSVSGALASPAAQEKLDGSVKFFFGDEPHPAILQSFREYVTNQKTNNFLKPDQKSCTWVFISALIELQKRAHDLGGNAVIGIHSYYKKEDVTIGSEVPCHVGAMIAGIALKGKIAKVAAQ